MTLRNCRRRISPRTRHRYRVIREFFRRAIGGSSQHDNSDDATSITDLKQKINGLENQIDDETKRCRDIDYLDNCSGTNESLLGTKHCTDVCSERRLKGTETKLIYKTSDGKYNKYEDSDYAIKPNKNQIMVDEYYKHGSKEKNKTHKVPRLDPDSHNYETRSLCNRGARAYSPNGFQSLTNVRVQRALNNNNYKNSRDRSKAKEEYIQEVIPQRCKYKKNEENMKKNKEVYCKEPYEIKPTRLRKSKKLTRQLDQDFIADIIQTQYQPMQIFSPGESDVSQFSVPVCRDQKYSGKEKFLNHIEPFSCVYDDVPRERSKHHRQDLNTIRSVCDTHFYNSKIHEQLSSRRKYMDAYYNSDMCDLVPVKEKSSPKARRKMVKISEDAYNDYREIKGNPSPRIQRKIIDNSNDHYREVPPSPRSLRPQLNLQAQYECHENYGTGNNSGRRSPATQTYLEFETNINSDVIPVNKITRIQKQRQKNESMIEKTAIQNLHQDTNAVSNTQLSDYVDEQNNINVDTQLDKAHESETNIEKADKALLEIKDVLQNFLHEIKKENIAPQCEKPDILYNSQNATNDPTHNTINLNSNIMPNSGSFNSYSVGQCGMGSHIASFSNPCCYPMVPLYPTSCPMTISAGYLSYPNQCFSCSNCGSISKESKNTDFCNKHSVPTCQTNETEKLIKEIHNFIAHGPIKKQDNERTEEKRDPISEDTKILTSRGVGESYSDFRQDAKIGTQLLKCYSKSCEAIVSKTIIDPYCNEEPQTDPNYSDTLLEKLSLEVTHSSSDNEIEYRDSNKEKGNKFSRVLRSFGLFKKKKKDVIEEFSESESIIDLHMTTREPSQFRQNITNSPMYGQEYYQPKYPNPHECEPEIHDHQSRLRDYQSSPHEHPQRPHDYQPTSREHQLQPREYQPGYQPRNNLNVGGHTSPQLGNAYVKRPPPRMRGIRSNSQYTRPPTAPLLNIPYEGNFDVMQPPLCLKEIEVKSTGTQSERKVSLFRKFKKTYQKPVYSSPENAIDQYQRSYSTQTPQVINEPTSNNIKPLFNWKKFHSKAMNGITKDYTLEYEAKPQKGLAGDFKLKKMLLKKLFYRRNPFSSRNLLMKTLLG